MNKTFTFEIADSWKWAAIITFVALGVLFCGNTFAKDSKESKDLRKLHEKSFNVKPGEKLIVSASVADVNVRTWDKDEFNIIVYGNSKAEDRLDFYFDKTSFGVKVRTEKRGNWISNLFGSNIQVKFDIMIPKKFELEASTSGGDITVGNLTGNKNLETSGGDIELSVTDGYLKAETSGGDIKLYKQNGNAKIETSGGDIIIKETYGDIEGETSGGDINADIRNGKIHLETSGGDIKLWFSGDNKGIHLETSGGDIVANVPGSIKASATFSSSGGDVKCQINASNVTKKSSHKFIGELNGGGPKFTAETSGGDVTVKEK
jgi:hypothetical protein